MIGALTGVYFRNFSCQVRNFVDGSYQVFRPKAVLLAVCLGFISWLGEGIGFYLILLGLGVPAGLETLGNAVFILAFSTIVGAVSTLPGGLVAAEASLMGMLVILMRLDQTTATAATLLIRLATLWFGVSLGLIIWAISPDLMGIKANQDPLQTSPYTSYWDDILMIGMLRIEFHTHTEYSADSLTTVLALVETCKNRGIDRVVITDHNTIAGAKQAQQMDPEMVIIGEEIMTSEGELLAAFVHEEVPEGLEPMAAIELLRNQGAFISVSHPFDLFRSPWRISALEEILPHIDAIETFNARCLWPGFNRNARRFASQHNLPGTSGSDAHTINELGMATLLVDCFDDAAGLRRVIGSAQACNQLSSVWVHLASRKAVQTKRRQEESKS